MSNLTRLTQCFSKNSEQLNTSNSRFTQISRLISPVPERWNPIAPGFLNVGNDVHKGRSNCRK